VPAITVPPVVVAPQSENVSHLREIEQDIYQVSALEIVSFGGDV
jgi:hypothetical protein